jgi:exonuclease III
MSGIWNFASWNICGLRKLARYPGVLAWLLSLQVVFLQESLQITRTFHFPGFARFDVPAVESRRRAVGGLVTLVSKSWLGNGVAEEIVTESFLQVVRISWQGIGILLCNVYVPIHSEGCPLDIFATIDARLTAVTSVHSGDSVLIG